MIVVLKRGAEQDKREQLINWLKNQGLGVHISEGEYQTVLGLIGDTARVDMDLIESLSIVDSVKRVTEPFKCCNRKFHPDDMIVQVGDVKVGGGNFCMIAGPCSVESEEQIVAVAKAVKASGANMLRGGAFKPRTSPYDFQGLKAEGIELLKIARQETGLPIVTEIMSEKHLDLFADVDIIQLGRTLNNIFSFRLDFFNIFDFILIVFVANLTYDLFQQVFQCDQTGWGTVFVQNDCQIDGCFTHFDHQVCCSFVFIGKIRLTQDVAD